METLILYLMGMESYNLCQINLPTMESLATEKYKEKGNYIVILTYFSFRELYMKRFQPMEH